MLKNRLITAGMLAASFLGALFFFSDTLWALFLLLFIIMGAWEWGGLAKYGTPGRLLFSGLVFALGLLLLPGIDMLALLRARFSVTLLCAAAIFWLALVPFWLARHWSVHRPAISVVTGLLVLLPPWIALIHLRQIGPEVVLVVMATVWLADSAAYFFGKRFGRRKLAPSISPGKTWEGAAGALFSVTLLGVILSLAKGLPLSLVFSLQALVVLSVIGDLFESLIKRQAGMKDSGSILPGHGGVLDRIDALTSTLPLAALYFIV